MCDTQNKMCLVYICVFLCVCVSLCVFGSVCRLSVCECVSVFLCVCGYVSVGLSRSLCLVGGICGREPLFEVCRQEDDAIFYVFYTHYSSVKCIVLYLVAR